MKEGVIMNRLLTTKEAAQATGLSEYELRKGAKEGRYPVLLLGSDDKKFRKMRWNLEILEETIAKRTGQNCYNGIKELSVPLSK